MRISIKSLLIALLVFVFATSVLIAAPKLAKIVGKPSTEKLSDASPTQKVTVPGEKIPAKEQVQTVTGVPSQSQVVTPTTENKQADVSQSVASAAAYSIDWYVIAGGGGSGTSTNYKMDGTVGQTAVGEGTSTNYKLNSGFWQNFGPTSCCISPRGDANNDGTNCNILDLTFLVDRIFRGGPPAVCLPEADMNGDGTSSNILDLTFTVDRIFRGGPAPGACL